MAAGYYPTGHQAGGSAYSYSSPGSAGIPGVASSGSAGHAEDYAKRHAPGPVYQLDLNRGIPPSVVDTGTNSLDDILKQPSKKNFEFPAQTFHP